MLAAVLAVGSGVQCVTRGVPAGVSVLRHSSEQLERRAKRRSCVAVLVPVALSNPGAVGLCVCVGRVAGFRLLLMPCSSGSSLFELYRPQD